MDKLKRQLSVLISCVLTLICALAPACHAEETAPETGAGRILWAMKCGGAMPKPMIIGFILLAVLAAAVIIIKLKEKKNEN